MIVVDAGHGGTDPGASGNGIVEKDYNLMIANYIYNRLKELGANVKAVRTTDETVEPDERVQRILNAFGNRPDVVVLSNHLNSGGGNGAEVVYALRNKDKLAELILGEIAKTGQNVRKWYQRRLPDDTSKDYYYIMRETGVTEPVLIEYGFMDDVEDANFIKSHWKDLAEATVRAVSIYKGIPYFGAPSGNNYVVQKGDSLYSIAKKLGVSVNALKETNNLTNNLLNIGQILTVPTVTTPTQPTGTTYTVKSGDNLYDIASRYNTTASAIKELNNLSSNLLSIGQVLKIPTTTTPTQPTGTTYTVKSGDNLYDIASRYNTTASAIKELNNLSSNLLSIGQVLKIPTTTTTGTTYTVKSGDNLYDIANRFNTTASAIRELNNLSSNLLSIGQVLKIPSLDREVQNMEIYIVKKGDTLYNLANTYNTTVNNIKKINNFNNGLLSIGQVLLIPISTEDQYGDSYTVEVGDSLASIANKFGISISQLKNFNNLTTDILIPNQVLLIPSKVIQEIPISEFNKYTVKKDDTIWTISNKFNVPVRDIRRLNNLTVDTLREGQVILLPEKALNYQIYIVKNGDTLYDIASRYNITADEIRKVNNLVSDLIIVGQELKLPV